MTPSTSEKQRSYLNAEYTLQKDHDGTGITAKILTDKEWVPLRNFRRDNLARISDKEPLGAYYETVIRTALDGFWVVDAEGNILDVNHAYCRLSGYSRAEVLTMKITDLEAAETAAETAEHIKKIEKLGADRFETRHRHKDGHLIDLEISVNYLDVDEARFFVFLHDLTKRNREKRLSDVLNDLNVTITSGRDVAQILSAVVTSATEVIGCDSCSVILQEDDRWRVGDVYGLAPGVSGTVLSDEEAHHLATVMKTKKALAIRDTQADERVDRDLMAKAGIRSFIAVPLIARDNFVGILAFHYRFAPAAFAPEQVDFAHKLAVSLALAIDNTRGYEASRRALKDARVLARVAARISGTLDMGEVLNTALDEALSALDTSHGCVYVMDEQKRLVMKTHRHLSEAFLKSKSVLEAGEGCAGATVVTQKTFAPPVGERAFTCAESKRLLGLDCLAAVPIIYRGESLGVLEFFAPTARRLTPREVEVAEALCDQLAAALQNAQSYQLTQQAMADAQTVSRVAAKLNRTLELPESLDTALDHTLAALDIRSGCIYIKEDGRLSIKKHRRLSPGFLKAKSSIGPGEGCAGNAAETQRLFAPSPEQPDYVCAYAKNLLALDCLAAVPIVYRGETLGVLELFAPAARRLTMREKRVVRTIGNLLAATIQNARLYGRERNIAQTLQNALLKLPDKIGGIDFGVLYRSATREAAEVGGDFYDLFELETGKVCLVVGDISGKGLEAATLTSLVRNTLRAIAHENASPSAIVRKAGRIIAKSLDPTTFVTAFLGLLDPQTGSLVYCGAGHPPGIIKRQAEEAVLLEIGDPVIGPFPGIKYTDHQAVMRSGDILVLYTDGAFEARRGAEFFGEGRLLAAIKKLSVKQTRDLPQLIFDEIIDFSEGVLADDIAVLAVSITGGAEGGLTRR